MDLLLLDVDAEDLVALADGLHRLHAGADAAEDAVLAVEVGLGRQGDEELAAVRAGPGVGHGEDAGVVTPAGAELVREAVAGAAGAIAARVAALDHERRAGDDTGGGGGGGGGG